MFKLLFSQKKILRTVPAFVVVVALGVLVAGCSEVTNPESPEINNEVLEDFTIIPSGDEADEAMFAVSTNASGDNHGDGLFSQLDLSEEQVAAIRAAFADACAELAALAAQLEAGEITEEEFLAASKVVHEELRATIWSILTEKQQAIVEGILTDRLIECLTKRIDNGPENIANRVARMTDVLGLDEDQQADITAIFEGALTDLTVIRDALVDGATDRAQAREDLAALYQATRDAVRDVLGLDQKGEHDGRNRDRHKNRRGGNRC